MIEEPIDEPARDHGDQTDRADTDAAGESQAPDRDRQRPFAVALRVAIVVACGLLGFILVAQVRAVEDFDQRLAIEREENLTRILSDLADRSDELARQITERRLLLYEFDVNSEREQIAVNSLRERLEDLRVLTGAVEVVGDEGIRLTIEDPLRMVGQDSMVDAIQELRDAGAEAIAIDGVRLVAQSSVTTRNDQLVLDGQPLESPYQIDAIGSASALSEGLAIPGGVESALRAREGVEVDIEQLGQVTLPARSAPVPFVFAEPVPEAEPTE
jgi:uncharacterized protein YlxW (UPF0749 family)